MLGGDLKAVNASTVAHHAVILEHDAITEIHALAVSKWELSARTSLSPLLLAQML